MSHADEVYRLLQHRPGKNTGLTRSEIAGKLGMTDTQVSNAITRIKERGSLLRADRRNKPWRWYVPEINNKPEPAKEEHSELGTNGNNAISAVIALAEENAMLRAQLQSLRNSLDEMLTK